MTIKSDRWILAEQASTSLSSLQITPFFAESVNQVDGKKVPSFGLTSYGYDIRLSNKFKRMHEEPWIKNDAFWTHPQGSILDICEDNSHAFYPLEADEIILNPKEFILGCSMEKIRMPPNVSAVCMGKSTIARNGLIVIVTPLEPGWEGYVTLEIFNALDRCIKLKAGIGITQVQFFQSDEYCMVSYKDRAGKYQNQPQEPICAR